MSKMFVDRDIIKDLATLLNDTDLSEIEVQDGERKIRVARNVTVTAVAPVAAAAPVAPVAAAEAVAPVAAADKDHPGAVTSPMVGTAYTAPDPDSPDFIKVGDKVTAGQTLLIVEAMKVMNQIHAPKGGIVTKLLVENSQPVEFGEVLVIIE
ncbi:acetyl-CoA carboxylase biotin carboxyl carrier protein [Paremcibacter congregatus]|uniref:Biotin carboxyl carrier protein of acetyl-CoA carboxylase n=1 Tax=Paremcibacter congregatus TaxID=2043170 RepID=A0A2G4YN68_9PROT|nr:acetyl-CoA carboxylase biotin carboxyl carrier protein [Paremcibacter congregatus]PHZ83779.1 acetyl-CoA carboxylase, biotin carboxyl carrier protein [Paremcibacter congregatus]QDE27484.1 acetyl-CoA carboxylase biotin carboxyl carrier protein [Paremcibacter congregatus]|tara:strand:+ start:6600 stop:7055 length:456 start_codon:yes stop_codon:yes gene_type:complete